MQRDTHALLAYLEQRAPMPHAFGSDANDCLSFLAGAVVAQGGRNPLGRLTWSDEQSALRVLAREGGVEAALDARFERIAPAHAHRGDIAAVADERLGMHPLLVVGRTLCSPGVRGLKHCLRVAAIAAWDVTRPKAGKPSRAARSTKKKVAR